MSIIESQELWKQLQGGITTFQFRRWHQIKRLFWGIFQTLVSIASLFFIWHTFVIPLHSGAAPQAVYALAILILALAALAYLNMAWSNIVRLRHFWSYDITLTQVSLALTRNGGIGFELPLSSDLEFAMKNNVWRAKGRKGSVYLPYDLERMASLQDAIVCLSQMASTSNLSDSSYKIIFEQARNPMIIRMMQWIQNLIWARVNHPATAYFHKMTMSVDNQKIEFRLGEEVKKVSWDEISRIMYDTEEPYHLALVDKHGTPLCDFYTGDYEGSSLFFVVEAERRGLDVQPGHVAYRPHPALAEADRTLEKEAEDVRDMWLKWGLPLQATALLVGLFWLTLDPMTAIMILFLNLFFLVFVLHENQPLRELWKKYRLAVHGLAISLSVLAWFFDSMGAAILAMNYLMGLGIIKFLKS